MRSGNKAVRCGNKGVNGGNKTAGNFRVIAGKYKGAKMDFPGGAQTHPMGAREKLALFNMISTSGMRVLDAYAGSGALGIEAVSRGAKEVVFVEKSRKVAAVIEANLWKIGAKRGENTNGEKTGEKPKKTADAPKMALEGAERPGEGREGLNGCLVKVWAESVSRIAQRSEYEGHFDLILADPPYDGFQEEEGLRKELGGLGRLLIRGGRMVLSSPAKREVWEIPGFEVEKTRTYAGARITVYNKG